MGLGRAVVKLLRGNNMQDVIFNGTKKRKSQSYAEVSLTFDNKNRSLFPSYDFEEVVITRKLFRSNESEYYINGTLCRLRDISDMLRDAGSHARAILLSVRAGSRSLSTPSPRTGARCSKKRRA